MSNVRVQFPSLDRETYSHSDGLYVFFGVPAGTKAVPQAYQAGSLYPADTAVEVQSGQTAATDIVMTPRQ
jgi:hypothetical protein